MEYVLIYVLLGLPYVAYSMLVSWDDHLEGEWIAILVSFIVQLLIWPFHVIYAVQCYVRAKKESRGEK